MNVRILPVILLSRNFSNRVVRRCLSFKNEEEDKPIKYSTSRAAKWKAEYSRRGDKDDRPWFESLIISGSLTVFMVWFCILREENDIDRKLDVSLYDRIEGLEKVQLEVSLDYYNKQGWDTRALKSRLEEISSKNPPNKI